MINRKYIVFCEEHYNPLGIVRSLGEYGIKPYVVVLKNKVHITSKSKYAKEVFYVESREQGLECIKSNFINKDKRYKSFIFCSDDKTISYIDMNYDKLKDDFIIFNAGSSGRITYYMNKKNIDDLALKHGLSVLKNWDVKRGVIPKDIIYPIITKSISSIVGGWKKDVFICNSEAELIEAYKKIQSSEVLLQKYIDKKNELVFEGFSYNKGKSIFLSIQTDYNYLIPNCYSPYMTIHNVSHKELLFSLNNMFKEIGFEGIFEVEFLIDKNNIIYFSEINFRNSTWSYASTVAGMPLPILWSKYMLNNDYNVESERIPFDDFHAMVELTDFKYRVIGKRCSLKKWLKDYNSTKCKYYYNKKDIIPFFSSLFGKRNNIN